MALEVKRCGGWKQDCSMMGYEKAVCLAQTCETYKSWPRSVESCEASHSPPRVCDVPLFTCHSDFTPRAARGFPGP